MAWERPPRRRARVASVRQPAPAAQQQQQNKKRICICLIRSVQKYACMYLPYVEHGQLIIYAGHRGPGGCCVAMLPSTPGVSASATTRCGGVARRSSAAAADSRSPAVRRVRVRVAAQPDAAHARTQAALLCTAYVYKSILGAWGRQPRYGSTPGRKNSPCREDAKGSPVSSGAPTAINVRAGADRCTLPSQWAHPAPRRLRHRDAEACVQGYPALRYIRLLTNATGD